MVQQLLLKNFIASAGTCSAGGLNGKENFEGAESEKIGCNSTHYGAPLFDHGSVIQLMKVNYVMD